MNPDAKTATPARTQDPLSDTILEPPAARREPVEQVLHGDRRVDHYAWLRHKENPEVIGYLEAENAAAITISRGPRKESSTRSIAGGATRKARR